MKRSLHGIILAVVWLVISGCTSVTDVSNELPYEQLVGQCYVLQTDMNIMRSKKECRAMGDMILTPYLKAYCLAEKVGEIPKGTEFSISAVQLRKNYRATCPMLVVELPNTDTDGGVISPPVCGLVRFLDWRQGEQRSYFRRGDTIELREDYVKPCGD